MPYSWQTPVYDRTNTSKYNASDTNRVDNNTRYLEEYMESNIGYTVDLDTYSTATVSTLPTVDTINTLESNINAIRDALGYDPLDWNTLYEDWTAVTNDRFLYTDANNLEENQAILKLNFEQIEDGFRECGRFNAGSKMTKL